jgi:hypothetical protein
LSFVIGADRDRAVAIVDACLERARLLDGEAGMVMSAPGGERTLDDVLSQSKGRRHADEVESWCETLQAGAVLSRFYAGVLIR